MIGDGGPERDLAMLVVPRSGRLVATGDRYEPYRLLDPGGVVVGAVAEYFRDVLAAGKAGLTLRSYGLALLRWFRFCWSDAGVAWDRATRVDARDFCRWLQVAGKHPRPHWRTALAEPVAVAGGGEAYAPSVRAFGDGAAVVL